MRVFSKAKDGGPKSPVEGYFLIEWKGLFSVALLKFNQGRRKEFHTHAFNAFTWFLSGDMDEELHDGGLSTYSRRFKPKYTPRSCNHRIEAYKDSWCLTIRGPWAEYWTEDNRETGERTNFTHGRKIVSKFNKKRK